MVGTLEGATIVYDLQTATRSTVFEVSRPLSGKKNQLALLTIPFFFLSRDILAQYQW